MTVKKFKILIVSYYFPPYPKVGGRRWAKFAKYLNRKGHDIHVLCMTFDQDKKSPWDKEIVDFSNKIHRIRTPFYQPYFKKSLPKTYLQKIKWYGSFYYHQFRLLLTKGRHDKQVVRNTKKLKKRARQLLATEKFQFVVVTGGPFSVPYQMVLLKKQFPEVKFIVDIRDPWSMGMTQKLSKRNYRFEFKREGITYKMADTILTVSELIKDDMIKRFNQKEKIYMLPHTFDQQDFDQIDDDILKQRDRKEIVFVYAGSLYEGMKPEIDALMAFVNFLIKRGYKPRVDFYSFSNSYKSHIEDLGMQKWVNYHAVIPLKKLGRVLSEANVLLQLRPKNDGGWEHFFSTKFFELLYFRKPILYVGPSSNVQDFLVKNNLGLWINSYNDKQTFEDCHEKLMNSDFPDKDFSLKPYEYQNSVNQLEKILSEL